MKWSSYMSRPLGWFPMSHSASLPHSWKFLIDIPFVVLQALLLVCACNPLAVRAQSPVLKALGEADNDQLWDVVQGTGGNWLVVGTARESAEGGDDCWIAAFDQEGRILWDHRLTGAFHEHAYAATALSDGGFAVAGYAYRSPGGAGRHDMRVIRLSPAGDILWDRLYGGNARDVAFAIRENERKELIVLGYSKSFGDRGDFFAVQLDAQGQEMWRRHYPADWVDYGMDIEMDAQGNYLFFGSWSGYFYPNSVDHWYTESQMFLIQAAPDGTEMWRRTYGGSRNELGMAIEPAADGGWYLLGSTQSEGAGSFDMWLLRVNAQGDSLWSRTYGGSDFEYGNALLRLEDGNLLLGGASSTLEADRGVEAYLCKVTPMGDLIWELRFGGPGSDYGYGLAPDGAGGCWMVGRLEDTLQGETDGFLARIDAHGLLMEFVPDTEGETILFPNPNTDSSVLDPTAFTKGAAFEMSLWDMDGKLIRRSSSPDGLPLDVPKGNLARGWYLLEVVSEGRRVATLKMMVD